MTANPGAQIEVGDRVIGVHATEHPRATPVIALTPTSRHDKADNKQEDTR